MIKSFFTFIHNFISIMRDMICPIACIVCEKSGEYLCPTHKKFLQKYQSWCYVCHKPTQYGEVCLEHRLSPCRGVIIWFSYTNIIKHMIHLAKYRGAYDICRFFAQQLLYDIQTNQYLMKAYHEKKLLITYIPMHRRKERNMRGYNQAAYLAQYLATELHISCLNLCTKHEHTKTQASLARKDRLKNITTAYEYTPAENLSHYTTVLLVDDVCTTGVTMETCASLIINHNPQISVRGIAVARNTV